MQCLVRFFSLSTVPYSMKNLIACFQLKLCLRNRNLLGCCIIVQYKKMRISCSQLHFVEFDVPRTNFSINSYEGDNRELYRTGPDQLYPRAFALRPNRVLLVLVIKRVIDEKLFALRLRTSAT